MSEAAAGDPSLTGQPVRRVSCAGAELTLLGTAHVSASSARAVERLLASGDYQAVALELCESRHASLTDPDSVARMDLFRVIREGRAGMVAAGLALGAFQQRLAEQFGIRPGAEMLAALQQARRQDMPVLLIDRELGVTLARLRASLPWWRRPALLTGLAMSVFSSARVEESEIERLKQGDMLESVFSEFASRSEGLYRTLITERDRFMAARLVREIAARGLQRVLVVVGAGHMAGLTAALEDPPAAPGVELERLARVPPRRRWPRYLAWAVVGAVLAGFGAGFARSPGVGWAMVVDWVLINGVLCALGAALALAHPLTVLGSFVAAPLTSLNPTIGAGFVSAAIELSLRRPRVGDFARLRNDVARPGGWWRNRVARTLLVFLFSTVGSALGTWLAGVRIAGRLLGH